MKDSKFKRTRHQVSLLRRQFLQGNSCSRHDGLSKALRVEALMW
jgi:hypothetical protein